MDESQGIVGTKLCRSYKFLEKGIRNVPVEFMILYNIYNFQANFKCADLNK